MRRLIFLTLAMFTIAALAAAAPILTLTPPSGNISGEPGGIAGFGFTFTADPDEWITVVSSFLLFETNPELGFYEDYMALQGGPDNGALAPGSPAWVQAFDPNQGFGLGAFFLSPLANVGDRNDAQLIVIYERFSADPSTCGTCNLGSGEFSFDVSITAAAASQVPEPGTLSLLVLSLVIAGAVRCRRQRQR
ncbi:MAG: PEP-CTERM sorting domain-containing protein [Bryobacterales bacterium]|nr:PEP-CTERM sorting domain-containing protein [Bryobacterales bacterium]